MSKFSLLLALLLALGACLPYREQIALVNSLEVGRDEDPETWECQHCSEENKPIEVHIIFNETKQAKASLALYEEYTVLAFRYTATVVNVLEDAAYVVQTIHENACLDRPSQKCKVHKEFYRLWKSIKTGVYEGLKKYSHTDRLIITGISLGGALATISFADIHAELREDYPKIEIITYGEPRVGNTNFARWFNETIVSERIFIKGDPIRLLPRCILTVLICNYDYVGTRIECNKDDRVCRANSCLSQPSNFLVDTAKYLTSEIAEYTEHARENGQLGWPWNIYDHIYGYPDLYDYDLCM